MSGLSGFLSISNSGYIPPDYQQWISLFVGFVNLMVTIISLIENFKKIDVNVNKTYTSYMEFKKLHDEISLILNTTRNERDGNGYDNSLHFFNRYESYLSDAPILAKTMHDFLDNNSPDNNSQTFMVSGSDNISENNKFTKKLNNQKNLYDNISSSYIEDIESQKIPTSFSSLKQILSFSNQEKDKINIFNKKTVDDRVGKVNKLQEQFNKMEKKVDNRIDDKINKINLENNLNISQQNFPKLKNVKISNNNDLKSNILFDESKTNLINILEDIEIDEDELIDEEVNLDIIKSKDDLSSSTN